MASDVVLRAFRPDEFETLFARLREWIPEALASDEAHWRAETEKRIARSGSWSAEDGLDLAIDLEDRLVGAIQALGAFYHLPPGVYELGIELYEAHDRGRGRGSAALEQFLRQ